MPNLRSTNTVTHPAADTLFFSLPHPYTINTSCLEGPSTYRVTLFFSLSPPCTINTPCLEGPSTYRITKPSTNQSIPVPCLDPSSKYISL